MIKYVKVLLCVGLFFVVGAEASNYTSFPMCEYMSTEKECQGSGECMWNAGAQRCEQGFQIMHHGHHGHHCSSMGYYECLRSRHCFWDRQWDSCRRNHW